MLDHSRIAANLCQNLPTITTTRASHFGTTYEDQLVIAISGDKHSCRCCDLHSTAVDDNNHPASAMVYVTQHGPWWSSQAVSAKTSIALQASRNFQVDVTVTYTIG